MNPFERRLAAQTAEQACQDALAVLAVAAQHDHASVAAWRASSVVGTAGSPTFGAHQPGFVYRLHRRHEPGTGAARTSASGIVIVAEHSGTHIDALCHAAENMSMHGSRRVDPQVQTYTGFTELGVETIPPMVARGVLLDVARFRGLPRLPVGAAVGAAELQATADAHDVRSGDVVLVRTGNGTRGTTRTSTCAVRASPPRRPNGPPRSTCWRSVRTTSRGTPPKSSNPIAAPCPVT